MSEQIMNRMIIIIIIITAYVLRREITLFSFDINAEYTSIEIKTF